MVGTAEDRFSLDTAYISLLISFVIHDCQKLTQVLHLLNKYRLETKNIDIRAKIQLMSGNGHL